MLSSTFVVLSHLCGSAAGVVVYTDIPDVAVIATPGSISQVDLDINGVGGADVSLVATDTAPGGGPWLWAQIANPGGEVYVNPALVTPFGMQYYARTFALGALLGTPLDLRETAALFVDAGAGSTAGHWLTPGTRFRGVRFDTPSGIRPAWIKISRADGPGGQIAVVHDFAYETEAGTLIAAGFVPSASTPWMIGLAMWGSSRRVRNRA